MLNSSLYTFLQWYNLAIVEVLTVNSGIVQLMKHWGWLEPGFSGREQVVYKYMNKKYWNKCCGISLDLGNHIGSIMIHDTSIKILCVCVYSTYWEREKQPYAYVLCVWVYIVGGGREWVYTYLDVFPRSFPWAGLYVMTHQ